MSSKSFEAAIEAYTKAIALDPTNPVYYSNRAAAYSSMDQHDDAIRDAEHALEVDPAFIKAYSRLGCVCSVLLLGQDHPQPINDILVTRITRKQTTHQP